MTIPKTMERGKMVYSNLKHQFEMTADEVKQSNLFHQHSAWDFCGYVWYDKTEKAFKEEIWIYNVHRATHTNLSLIELIEKVNSIHGYD